MMQVLHSWRSISYFRFWSTEVPFADSLAFPMTKNHPECLRVKVPFSDCPFFWGLFFPLTSPPVHFGFPLTSLLAVHFGSPPNVILPTQANPSEPKRPLPPRRGAFMEAGVAHVVCCRGRVFDGACKTFTKAPGDFSHRFGAETPPKGGELGKLGSPSLGRGVWGRGGRGAC